MGSAGVLLSLYAKGCSRLRRSSHSDGSLFVNLSCDTMAFPHFSAVVISFCLLVTSAERCGSPEVCVCLWSAKTLMCDGRNITFFPFFEKEVRNNMVTLILSDTSVMQLTDLKSWPNLDTVVLENNRCLNCSSLSDKLVAVGDCPVPKHSLNLECKAKPASTEDSMAYHVISLISLLCFVLMFGMRGLEAWYKKNRSSPSTLISTKDVLLQHAAKEEERTRTYRSEL